MADWEGSAASEKFARLPESQGHYAGALLRAYSRPGSTDPARLRSLQLAARRARGDAEASPDRLADEPAWPPMTPQLATALTSAVRRFAQASLTLDAAVALRPDGLPRLRLLHNAVAAEPGASKTLVDATDALVDSVNTAADTLRAGLGD